MSDQDKDALLTALTTEHFVLQTAINGTLSETSSRASIYLVTLSSSLIALGFVAGREVLLPFVATVLPAVFVLGVFTVIRLVDAALEMNNYLAGIARIHGYYRTQGPEAEEYFAPHLGRWPETMRSAPVFRLGTVMALLTTNASMLAFINSLVAGAGATLLVSNLSGLGVGPALLAGGGTTLVLIFLFYRYQRWRYRALETIGPSGSIANDTAGAESNNGSKTESVKRHHRPGVRRAAR